MPSAIGTNSQFPAQTPSNQPLGQPYSSGPVGPTPTPVPTVTVNAAGILELPYNSQITSGMQSAVDQANTGLLGLKDQQDAQGLSYQQQLRDTQQGYQQQQLATRNQAGASGTLFSSKYGRGVQQNAQGFANKNADIESQNSAFAQSMARQRQAIQDSLNRQLGTLAQEAAEKAAEEAGNLGYGTTKPPSNTAGQAQLNKLNAAKQTRSTARAKWVELRALYAKTKKPADKARLDKAHAAYTKAHQAMLAAQQKYNDYKG